jgi:hypothetical protein
MDRIGFLCEPAHPTFWPVAERLSARGFEIRFLNPTDPVAREDVDALDALVEASIGRTAFEVLRYADRVGVETWNGFVPTTALASRLVALEALEAVDCPVPEVRADPPTRPDEYVERGCYRWDAAAATFYQRRLDADTARHRYYAVDDGRETHVRAVTVRSELSGLDDLIASTDVEVEPATRVRELLSRFGARAVAVDFLQAGDAYAVDVDPAPTFVGARMDQHVADAVASLTTIGA